MVHGRNVVTHPSMAVVNCDDSCIKDENDIFGTVFYSEHSPVCKSAIHDFRISQWNVSERTVTFKREQPRNVYFGSKRMHLSSNLQDLSKQSSAENGITSYKFVSPYISESPLDVASLHREYLFGEKGVHYQFCYISKRNITFYQYCNTNIQKPCLTLHIKKNYNRGAVGLFLPLQAEWKVDCSSNRTLKSDKLNAGYQCVPANKTLSTVTSIAFRKDAYFYPTTFTKTVNVDEEVNLQMTEKGACKDTVWRKDRGDPITQDVERTSISFSKVEVGHSGIYSLECRDSDITRAGFIHLIVRTCPEGKHGHLCTRDCPDCSNGGVCHDLNGECVCPPGFYGLMCEKTCPPGLFGRNCNMKCANPLNVDDHDDDSGEDDDDSDEHDDDDEPPEPEGIADELPDELTCKGALICLPHPYGCSCGAGFRGLFCNETCKPGTYGARCSQKRECHCSNGKGCSIYTGSCDEDCAPGWFGKHCDNYMAKLSFNPASSSAVNLAWKTPSQLMLLLLMLHTLLYTSVMGGGIV
ncbi:unnamed protein product [Larinioides sclopetarius]|uniref:Uncharacterized protein n=2 Tax=Larinioides sclopetarius TaxID=280406 RepID=A0AAV1ZV45_9ARAC